MKLKIKKYFVLMLSVFMVGSVTITGNAEDRRQSSYLL